MWLSINLICILANICISTVILFGTTFVLRDTIKKQLKQGGKNLSTISHKTSLNLCERNNRGTCWSLWNITHFLNSWDQVEWYTGCTKITQKMFVRKPLGSRKACLLEYVKKNQTIKLSGCWLYWTGTGYGAFVSSQLLNQLTTWWLQCNHYMYSSECLYMNWVCTIHCSIIQYYIHASDVHNCWCTLFSNKIVPLSVGTLGKEWLTEHFRSWWYDLIHTTS